MNEFKLQPDPEKVRRLQEFRKIEPEVFVTNPDQKAAGDAYHRLSTAAFLKSSELKDRDEGLKATLTPGTVVYRGGVFQTILKPYKVDVASVDRDFVASKQLPDGSVVYFSALSIRKPSRWKDNIKKHLLVLAEKKKKL